MADKEKKEFKNPTISPEDWANFKRNDIPTEVNSLMRNAYLQYSVSANIGRAIPDVRDGLKPGARRILYAMKVGGYGSSGGTNKCAKVVGLVIGNYHPHGDTAVYDTIVHMAQDFSMRVPLIFPKGNFGNMDGDKAAAYRYTECKMEKAAEALLADLDKETVDMRETFDGKEMEPTVLPAAFPNLLVNGSQGIGVGMATNIPPHNLAEAINATVAVIDNPNITVDELMEIMPGPDFPTGGIVYGQGGVRKLYATGQGTIRIRAKIEVVEGNGKESLRVTEVPFGVNKENMVKSIADMIESGQLTGISDINDYSSKRAGVRIEITLAKDATPSVVINELYKMTPLESTLPGQFLVVDHNRPRTMTLIQVLEAYIDHREEVIRRRTQFLLNKALARAHIIEGLFIAQRNIDEIIKIIRASRDRAAAQQQLMARFELDEIQSNAILDMRLAQLTNLAIDELQAEYDALQRDIAEYNRILSCRENIIEVVRKELLEVRDKFATPRLTKIEAAENDLNRDGLTKREIYVITLTRQGYIKRCSAEEYEQQNRGGSGVKGITARKDGDTVQMVLSTRSHNSLLFFTNFGRVYRLARAYELPETKRADAGRFVSNVLSFFVDPENPDNHEEIRAILPYDEMTTDMDNTFVVMLTKHGIIKRCSLANFKNLRKVGKRAITFKEDDDLIDAQLTDGTKDILISSREGRAVRFNENKVRAMGTMAAGVRAIKLRTEADGTPGSVVSMAIVEPDDELLVITAKGYGKRTPIGLGRSDDAPEQAPADENTEAQEVAEEAEPIENEQQEERSAFRYRLTNRGTQGCISVKLREGDYVVAAMQVPAECTQDILMLTAKGQAVRTPVSQIRLCGRASQGVIAMRMAKDDDCVVNVSLVDELSEEDAAMNAAKAEAEEQLLNASEEPVAEENAPAEATEAVETESVPEETPEA